MMRSRAVEPVRCCALIAVAAIFASGPAPAQVPNPPTGLSVVGGESLPPDPPSGSQTGLDWDGNAPALRMLYWHNVPNMYPMTVFAKTYMRSNASITRADGSRYGTIFFWGNDGDGQWTAANENNSYWGIEPFPAPAPGGQWKFEVAAWNRDYVIRDNGSSPYIVNNQWYSLALVATSSGGQSAHKAWVNLPSTAPADIIQTLPAFQQSPSNWGAEPPKRAIFFGQSPPHPDNPILSWGSYYGWDECNCIIRGIQMYTVALTQAQIVALQACNTDQCVLDTAAAQGVASSLWYLNMNPKPTDVTDKSGRGHHGSWNGAGARPTLWTGS